MTGDSGSNSVSIVAIVAILVLIGLVLYFVLRPSGDGGLEIDVDVEGGIGEDIGLLAPPSSGTFIALNALMTHAPRTGST